MSSHKAPNTHCVHIFDGEFQLLNSRSQTLENNSCCFLYGLWTHTSNAVVHLVVLTKKEIDYAKKHNLDCVGYVAKCYKKTLYDSVLQLTKLSSTRQHIIVDVHETTQSKSLKAYGTHHDVVRISEEASSQGHPLQVNILQGESPFRKEFFKVYPQLKNTNDYKSKTENGYGSCSDELNSQELMYKAGAVNPVSKELNEMNPENSTESETAIQCENMNGHQAKLNPDSSDIQWFKHNIKFQLKIKGNIVVEKSFGELLFHFEHNCKQWQIALTQDPASGKKMAKIGSNQETKDPQEFSSKNVLNTIKNMCQCETCRK